MPSGRYRATFRKLLLPLICVLAVMPSIGQQEARPDVQTPSLKTRPKASVADIVKPGEFYNRDLDLHFNFPVEMRAQDPREAMEKGHQNVYGVSGASDPEHREAERCARPLLDAELPEDDAPKRPASLAGVWVDEPKQRRPEPITATILMVEIMRDCLPKELQNNEDAALGNIALSFVSMDGIERMPKPIWYETGNQKIHMNSGAGRPAANGERLSSPIIIMSMSTQWRGHLLAWVFTSNDTEILNEITKSLVRFGDGPWGPMFAANIGQGGKPMTILPR